MDLKKFIGERIKHFREKQGMSQELLAEKLNTTKQTVSRYERGDRQANQDILFQLSGIFNVSIDEFFPKGQNKDNTNDFERALKMAKDLDIEEMNFLKELIEKTLSMDKIEREKFLESIKFTVDYHKKINGS